jgi:hypothetical protein
MYNLLGALSFAITAFGCGLIQGHGLSMGWAGFLGWPMKAQARQPLQQVAILMVKGKVLTGQSFSLLPEQHC